MTPPTRQKLETAALIVCALGLALLMADAPAQTRTADLQFSELVDRSDAIFLATCIHRETVFQNGNFVTKCRLKPSEFLKGGLKLNKEGEVEYEELGGSMEFPVPVTQHVPDSANIEEGEEVLLFGAYSKLDREAAGLDQQEPIISPNSFRIVGGSRGRFSVVTHPETGLKLVARPNIETRELAHVSESLDDQVKAAAQAAQGKAAPGDTSPRTYKPSKAALEAAERRTELANEIDRTAKQMRTEREMLSKNQASVAEEVHQFEPLKEVRARILRLTGQIEPKAAPPAAPQSPGGSVRHEVQR